MEFKQVKDYFESLPSDKYVQINYDSSHDLERLCAIALDDLSHKLQGFENGPTLGQGDLDYASLLTFHLVYDLVADEEEGIDEFAQAWAELYTNYLKAFYPSYNKLTYVQGLTNLLELKNNMARLITLSGYIIFKKDTDDYKNVSSTFIQSIINNQKG